MQSRMFDGTDEKWADWSLQFEAYATRRGFGEHMTEAAQRRTTIRLEELDEQARVVSKRLWHYLLTYCDGKAAGVVMRSPMNGLEAWRQL